jgi:hypothetical protein
VEPTGSIAAIEPEGFASQVEPTGSIAASEFEEFASQVFNDFDCRADPRRCG